MRRGYANSGPPCVYVNSGTRTTEGLEFRDAGVKITQGIEWNWNLIENGIIFLADRTLKKNDRVFEVRKQSHICSSKFQRRKKRRNVLLTELSYLRYDRLFDKKKLKKCLKIQRVIPIGLLTKRLEVNREIKR